MHTDIPGPRIYIHVCRLPVRETHRQILNDMPCDSNDLVAFHLQLIKEKNLGDSDKEIFICLLQ